MSENALISDVLIVVDMQNDFIDGALGFDGARPIVDRVAKRINHHRIAHHPILFTYDTHGDEYLQTEEGRHLPVVHCVKGTPGWQLYPEIATLVESEDMRFEKPTFGSLEMAQWFARHANEFAPDVRIELTGLVSNICVLSNAVMLKTALPNARIIVNTAATASFDEELQARAYDVLRGIHIACEACE